MDKINWSNIIYNSEFLNCLNIELLINISIISKSHRKKLSPLVFANLNLCPDKFKFEHEDNLFIEYFKSLSNTNLLDNFIEETRSCNSDNELSSFSSSLQNIKLFARSFYFSKLHKSGYYLFSLIESMSNLTILKLRQSFVPYSSFSKLGQTLINLIDIELFCVTFVKLPEDNSKPDNFILPPNLNYLKIFNSDVVIAQLISNTYEFLFNKLYSNNRASFSLPNISVPSLKILSFYPYSSQDTSLSEFLSVNSKLESLKTSLFNLAWVNNLTKLKSLEIKKLLNFNTLSHIHKLESLNKLVITNVSADYYENIKKFCMLYDKLECLSLRLVQYDCVQQFIDTLVIPVIQNFQELKTLHLDFPAIINGSLNLGLICDVDMLIIKTRIYNIMNLYFEECINLKSIRFELYNESYDLQMLKDKFNSYTNWRFEFGEDNIFGVKIN